jgi:hypothetical protein
MTLTANFEVVPRNLADGLSTLKHFLYGPAGVIIIAGSFSTVSSLVISLYRKRRSKTDINSPAEEPIDSYSKKTEYEKTIDSIYAKFYQNKEQCITNLIEMEKQITNSFVDGDINYSLYLDLSHKILDYIEGLLNGHRR